MLKFKVRLRTGGTVKFNEFTNSYVADESSDNWLECEYETALDIAQHFRADNISVCRFNYRNHGTFSAIVHILFAPAVVNEELKKNLEKAKSLEEIA